jgi:hypothetical protein
VECWQALFRGHNGGIRHFERQSSDSMSPLVLEIGIEESELDLKFAQEQQMGQLVLI